MESQSETTQTVSALKLPVLKTGEYDLWSMRMEQYLTFTDHALWEVIVNGDSVSPVASASTGAEGPIPPKTAEQKLARKNELKAKSTLMLAIPDEHLLKFHACKDAKSLWEAIKNRFGGNKESKKMQKTILKQNYENFAASSQEGLDKTYDRFQKLISQLEIHGEVISQEDANLKLLRSLPSAWNNIALIMRNKSDLDTLSMDDLYNNLKVYESEIKGKSSSSSNSQNVAFVSSDNSSSTNETVNTAHSVSAASSKDQASTASYADDVMFSFFANQSNAPTVPPLLLPSTSHRTDIPEAEMPPRKRACFTTPAFGFEVRQSSAATAVRQPGPTLKADLRRDRILEARDPEPRDEPAEAGRSWVADPLAEHDADRSRNGDDIYDSGGGKRRRMPVARECTYTDFLKCQPLNFKVTEGVVGLTQWTVRHDVAYAMSWKTLKNMMTGKYCPRGEIKNLETKIWNLKVKGTDVLSYNQSFQELELMCDRMFPEESDEVEKYVDGLSDMIYGSVKASKPKTMQEAIEFATELIDQKILTLAERQAKNKRKFDDTSRNNQNQQQPFKRNNVAWAYTEGPQEKKPYKGSKPLYPKCNYYHDGQCAPKCTNCKRIGHSA
ncbi:ribonuclease H-like domain-containing protein [Tanacetum coccineum]